MPLLPGQQPPGTVTPPTPALPGADPTIPVANPGSTWPTHESTVKFVLFLFESGFREDAAAFWQLYRSLL